MCGSRSNCHILCLFIFTACFLVTGAFLFAYFENEREMEDRRITRHVIRFFKKIHNISDEALEMFMADVVRASQRGISPLANVSGPPNWSFGQSFFFAGSVLTTIGYGHAVPLSVGGKIFCVVYALIGIPLTLILFTGVVERLIYVVHGSLKCLQKMMNKEKMSFSIRMCHLSLTFVLVCGLAIFLPAFIFFVLEPNWSYLDALYYCIISLTTIGLGDFIPGDSDGQKYREIYKIVTTVYLFFGLIMMMFLLANIYDVPELNFGKHFWLNTNDDPERRGLNPGNNKKYTDDKKPLTPSE